MTPHKLSPKGRAIIERFEKKSLSVYLCPANKVTIGTGHVLLPKFDAALFHLSAETLARLIAECMQRRAITIEAKQKLYITDAQAEALLTHDVSQTELFLNSVTQVPINQNQFDALASFIFNVGQGNYAGSTLRKKLATGDFSGAAAAFDDWVYGTVAGSKVRLPGLVARRAEERALFESFSCKP